MRTPVTEAFAAMIVLLRNALAMVAALAVGAAPAKADLFNDYGPAYTYNTSEAYTLSGSASFPPEASTAFEFTSKLTDAVTSLDFGLGLEQGTNSVVMDLMTD